MVYDENYRTSIVSVSLARCRYFMKTRSDKNSATSAVAGFAGAIDDVPLPEGVTLMSEALCKMDLS